MENTIFDQLANVSDQEIVDCIEDKDLSPYQLVAIRSNLEKKKLLIEQAFNKIGERLSQFTDAVTDSNDESDEKDSSDPLDTEDEDVDLPDDKLYLYDLLSMDPLLAMQLQSMAEKLSEERIVQILTGFAIRAAASVNNRNPIEGYYWATLTADIIQAICVKREIDPVPISEFINTEQFEYLLRQFETI